jgi:hypothetical protein
MIKFLALFILLVSNASNPLPAPEIWAEPVPLFSEKLQEQYLAPVSKYAAGHRGIDLRIPLGGAIFAPQSGEIAFADQVVNRNVVTLLTDSGKKITFEPACTDLRIGTRVNAGDQFAQHCKPDAFYDYHCESCIHYSVRTQFGYLSPMYFHGALKPSILKS